MTVLEKMKSGELYDCSFEAIDEDLDKKLYECKELLYDFNHSRPRDVKYREDILRKVFAETGETIYIEPPLNAQLGLQHPCGRKLLCQLQSNFGG